MAAPRKLRPGSAKETTRRLAALAGLALATCAASIVYPALAQASTSPVTVAAKLGVSKIPNELVILVDVSQSMAASSGGLYPALQNQLPRFLHALAKQDPEVTVAIVTFGSKADTQQVYIGQPTGDTNLPPSANSRGTDFGRAFQLALDILSRANPAIKVGGVLLLSDGQLFAPGDSPYSSFSAPGWARLRHLRQSLSFAVTGYDLPLSTDPAVTGDVRTALEHVFTNIVTLAHGNIDLSQELATAQQKVQASLVAQAARPDIGRGVRATWINLPGNHGVGALDLSQGSGTVQLRLTATTRLIPLIVSDLSLDASRFPVRITAVIPHRAYVIAPGHSVTVPVHLMWHGLSGGNSILGGSKNSHGQLLLNGVVSSSYTPAIHNVFGDGNFAVGALTGALAVRVNAAIPVGPALGLWLLVLLGVLAAVGLVGYLRASLGGQLVFTSVDGQITTLELPRRPWGTWSTERLIGAPGQIRVRGSLAAKKMHIQVKLHQDRKNRFEIGQNGHRMLAGAVVEHRDRTREPVKARPAPAAGTNPGYGSR